MIGGNWYLSVYLACLIIGNSKIQHKKNLFYYFDGISWIMQIALFFILGLLSFPSKFPMVIGISVAISVFLIFVARPAAVFLMLKPFGYSIKEKLFVSWVGLRGAASLVFAIYAMTYGVKIENDIFKLIDYIGEKNSSSAIKILNDMIEEGESVLGIFAMISRQFKTVLQVKQLQLEGRSINDICQMLNVRQFVVNKALKQSRNFSNEVIIDMLNFILENDFKIKNGLIKDTLAVEILVSKYCQRNIS